MPVPALLSRTRLALIAGPYLLVSGVHLWGKFQDDPVAGMVESVTKPMLMPTLLLAFLAAVPALRALAVWLTAAGITLSWLGDILLYNFVVGLIFFLVAHLAYIPVFMVTFPERRMRWWSLAYVAVFGALVWVLAPHLGDLLVPVIVYGVVLCAMAAVASKGNWQTALGGALFLASDSILALNRFHPDDVIPWNSGFLVMVTYLAAQGLIAEGILRQLRAGVRAVV